jgi:hypothetical protein
MSSIENNLRNMSLKDLKSLAKSKDIKHYYIMKKDELIQLLEMPALPMKYRLEKITMSELRDLAKKKGLRGFWYLNREQMISLLFPDNKDVVQDTAPDKQNENQGNTKEHDDPQCHHPQNVGV